MRSDLEDVGLGRQREGKRAGWRREAPSLPPHSRIDWFLKMRKL